MCFASNIKEEKGLACSGGSFEIISKHFRIPEIQLFPQSYNLLKNTWEFFLCLVFEVLTTMEKVVQETVNYTRQRKIFNQPILYHQVVHFRLAELQTEIELLRSLLHRATGESDRFFNYSGMILKAKAAMQFHGFGSGRSTEPPISELIMERNGVNTCLQSVHFHSSSLRL